MRESVIYQEIIERGLAQGIERGLAQGIERGLAQGIERGLTQGIERGVEQGSRAEAVKLARAFLERRFGSLPQAVAWRVERLSRAQAEMLALETLNFDTLEAALDWLAAQPLAPEPATASDE